MVTDPSNDINEKIARLPEKLRCFREASQQQRPSATLPGKLKRRLILHQVLGLLLCSLLLILALVILLF